MASNKTNGITRICGHGSHRTAEEEVIIHQCCIASQKTNQQWSDATTTTITKVFVIRTTSHCVAGTNQGCSLVARHVGRTSLCIRAANQRHFNMYGKHCQSRGQSRGGSPLRCSAVCCVRPPRMMISIWASWRHHSAQDFLVIQRPTFMFPGRPTVQWGNGYSVSQLYLHVLALRI